MIHIKKRHGFIAIALAAALLFASGQKAKCVIGYVNSPVTKGYNFLNNPLDVDGTNSITNVFANAAVSNGTKVYLWYVTNQVFSPPSTYSATTTNWSVNYLLPPGRGFVLYAPTNFTITFVGSVEEGSSTNFVAGTNKFSLLGCMVPIAKNLNALSFPGFDGDNAITFSTATQNYSDAFTYFNGFGWFDSDRVVDANGPVINVAQGFFVQNAGPNTNWVIQFSVHAAAEQPAPQVKGVVARASDISHVSIHGGKIFLQIANPSGATYDVQHSEDGLSWTTVAANQTGTTWSGPSPTGARGFYQVVSHDLMQ